VCAGPRCVRPTARNKPGRGIGRRWGLKNPGSARTVRVLSSIARHHRPFCERSSPYPRGYRCEEARRGKISSCSWWSRASRVPAARRESSGPFLGRTARRTARGAWTRWRRAPRRPRPVRIPLPCRIHPGGTGAPDRRPDRRPSRGSGLPPMWRRASRSRNEGARRPRRSSGGSPVTTPLGCRAACRVYAPSTSRSTITCFRVVLSP